MGEVQLQIRPGCEISDSASMIKHTLIYVTIELDLDRDMRSRLEFETDKAKG